MAIAQTRAIAILILIGLNFSTHCSVLGLYLVSALLELGRVGKIPHAVVEVILILNMFLK